MQPSSLTSLKRSPGRPGRGPGIVVALTVAAAIADGAAQTARADCPWIVQPHADNQPAEQPAFGIVFNGLDPKTKVFYGFTVTSVDAAWQLTNGRLGSLGTDGRKLQPTETGRGTTAYRLAPETIEPQTIYLVAAESAIDQLERLEARIDQLQPVLVSQLMPTTRGGSDWSGPLPPRSLPGFEISEGPAQASDDADALTQRRQLAMADTQICAYQVAAQ